MPVKRAGGVAAVGLGGQSVFLGVEHFHAPGETVRADSIYTEPGGKAYNQAVAAARLGAPALFIGAVGDDKSGRSCRDFLDSEGVSSRLQVCPSEGTAYACILTDKLGDNRVTVYRGAADRLSGEFVRSCRGAVSECSVLLLGLECPMEAAVAALELGEELGIYTILNPAPARRLDPMLLRRFDLITPNAQEAAMLLGLENAEPSALCAALHAAGIAQAVVTLGADGALLYAGGAGLKYPAVRCKAADTTGAGDCFNGALAARLAAGEDLTQAVGYAVAASSLSVTRSHVMTALPSAEAVRAAYTYSEPEIIWRIGT